MGHALVGPPRTTHLAIYTDAPFVSSSAKPRTYLAPCTIAHLMLLASSASVPNTHHPRLPPLRPPPVALPPRSLPHRDRPPLVPSLTFALRLLLKIRASDKDLRGSWPVSRRSRLHLGPRWVVLFVRALLPRGGRGADV
jgi:hypothetical protein